MTFCFERQTPVGVVQSFVFEQIRVEFSGS